MEDTTDAGDLRNILARNIRAARKARHLTQADLAQRAGLSLPYMVDIEHCKTWVSDKTLRALSRALSMEPYQLLIPLPLPGADTPGGICPPTGELLAALKEDISQSINDHFAKAFQASGAARGSAGE